jgi:heavy metal efflux system protein
VWSSGVGIFSMIERIIDLAISKRALAITVFVLVGIFGFYSWTQLQVEAYPDIADVTSQVITQAPGLAAEEVEQQITVPLERELNGTPGLVSIRSKSTFGLSLITLVFRDGSEDYWSRQRVQERIQNVTLPAGITAGLDDLTSPIGEIYRYTLESKSKTLRQLSEIQRWIVIPAFKQVPGVVNVNNFGGLTTQFQVELNPDSLNRFGVALKDVTGAITANTQNSGGSVMNRGQYGYVIRGIGLAQTLDDIGNIVVTQKNGTPVFVRDLGELRLSHQERHGILGKDDNNDTIEGIVLLLKGENPSQVMDSVHAKVAALNAQLRTQDVQLVPYIDRSDLVHATVEKVSHTIMEGVGLVLIVLILFLGSPRSAVIVAVTIPLAMAIAFILMRLTSIPANLLSLGAIDFGIIVDGAVVMTEAILRRREAHADQALTEADVRQAAHEVARPIFFSTLIIITAYFPLFAFQRVEAKLFSPMAYVVGYSLFGALLIALALIPSLAFIAYRRPQRVWSNPVLGWLRSRYASLLDRSLKRPRFAVATALVSAALVVVLGWTVGRDYLPQLDEGSIWLQVTMPAGISLETATEMAADLRRAVRQFPEVSYVVTQDGRNDDGTDPFTPSHIEASVGLRPYSTWPRGETKAELIQKLDARFRQMPGFQIGFTQPMIDGVYDKIAGAHSQLVVKIFGDDLGELRRIATQVVSAHDATPGSADVSIDQEPPLPQVVVQVDRAALARYGINVSDVSDLIQTGIGGQAVTQLFIADRQYDVSVRFPQPMRSDPQAISSLVLTSSTGAKIPLSQVASVQLKSGESTIAHDTNARVMVVKLDYRDRDLSSFLEDAKKHVAESVKFDPNKFRIEWGGQFENQQRAEVRLLLILCLVLGGMLVLLYAAFAHLRQAVLVLGAVPLATLGGLVALHLTGVTLNVASAVGFIALFGVAVQNSIILIANINRIRDDGVRLVDAVISGAGERLRPVLMTASVATLGMLPAVLATGVGSDVQRSLATVVVGGLLLTTPLTLLVLPTVYFVIESWIAARRPIPVSIVSLEGQQS